VKISRPVRFFIYGLASSVLGFVIISGFFALKLTGPARRPFGTTPERFLSAYENVHFPAQDGLSLSGWFVPCAGAKQAVLLLHGHGSTRTQMLARAKLLHDHGYAVLLYDARGHGESEGSLVSFGWFEANDLLGALDWLRTRGFTEFGCIGVSQGGATVAFAAAKLRDVHWVVLESTYPTMRNAVDRRFRLTFGLPGWLAGSAMIPFAAWHLGVSVDRISPRDFVAKLPCPVLVMNGDRDKDTFPEDAREFFASAREPKSFWLVPGAGHVDLYGFAKGDYERRLLDFISVH
jgi:pimeloyl-ACP methyl ester carboxylesterase